MSRLPVPSTTLSNPATTKYHWTGAATLDSASADNLLHPSIIRDLALKPSLQAVTALPGATTQGMIEMYTVNVQTKVNDTEAFIFLEGKGKLPGDVVLGVDWMARTGAVVDWETGRIERAEGGAGTVWASDVSGEEEIQEEGNGPNGYNPELARGDNRTSHQMQSLRNAGLLAMGGMLKAKAKARRRNLGSPSPRGWSKGSVTPSSFSRSASPPPRGHHSNRASPRYSSPPRTSLPLHSPHNPYRQNRGPGLPNYGNRAPPPVPPYAQARHMMQQRRSPCSQHTSRLKSLSQGAQFYGGGGRGGRFDEDVNWEYRHPHSTRV
ncbi:hypothetical protein B7494_g7396 [Chlorociboria aeruginascens]|nr:hypothetical protein B7494_g7396 [Chlorociboria aeruginascens]